MVKVFDPKVLKRMRKNNDWSLEILADHLKRHGMTISYGTIRNWEEGTAIPNANEIYILADVFESDSSDFFKEPKKAKVK